ncbi:proton-coupled folate transporter-like [Patiria miniata]|uniref:Major facilitator superfamily (MFS) profile domain-containing protein n=1 Tax=Patiria miniata TaxID=46514 RepID=A0A914BGE0_PATMI|nr:proton-coupled folate transporter-like [Patiria miniata]
MAEYGGFLSRHVAETALFMYTFGIVMQWPVTQNLILDKSCQGRYGRDVCDSLSDHPEMEEEVQASAAFWVMTMPSMTGIIMAFSSLLLGSVSDRFGRATVLILTCIGGIAMSLCLILQTTLTYLSPTLLLVGCVAMGLSGGIGTFLVTLFNYITDNTPETERTSRLSAVQPFAGLGTISGMLLSGVVSKHLGFGAVYAIFLCTQATVLIMVAACMQDSSDIKLEDSRVSSRPSLIAGMIESLTAGARICVKPRSANTRKHILFLVLTGVISMVGVGADMGLTVLYTRRAPFHWEPTMFGYFTASKNVGQILGMALGTRLLLKLLGSGSSWRDDLTLMQIASLGVTVGSLVMSAATTSSQLFLVPMVCILSGPGQAASGSFSSKLVHPTEKGAFSSFSSFLNNLAMPGGTLVFTTLYSWTSAYAPGFAFFVQAVMYTIPLVLMGVMKNELSKTAKDDA